MEIKKRMTKPSKKIQNETLIILMEECGEVIQECSKILRFGNDATKLTKELGDLLCMVELTANHLQIDEDTIEESYESKREKLKKYSSIILSD